jgi:hypothetical protein
MAITIPLTSETEERLMLSAQARGVTVADFAKDLLERAAYRPTIDQILSPIRAEFAQTQMTNEDLLEFGTGVLNKLRIEKNQ